MTNLLNVVVIAINITTNYQDVRVNEKFSRSEENGKVCVSLCYDSEKMAVESIETNVVIGAQIGSNVVALGQIRLHDVTDGWWSTNRRPATILFDDDLIITNTTMRVRSPKRQW